MSDRAIDATTGQAPEPPTASGAAVGLARASSPGRPSRAAAS